jgi:hypothetical protein
VYDAIDMLVVLGNTTEFDRLVRCAAGRWTLAPLLQWRIRRWHWRLWRASSGGRVHRAIHCVPKVWRCDGHGCAAAPRPDESALKARASVCGFVCYSARARCSQADGKRLL